MVEILGNKISHHLPSIRINLIDSACDFAGITGWAGYINTNVKALTCCKTLQQGEMGPRHGSATSIK